MAPGRDGSHSDDEGLGEESNDAGERALGGLVPASQLAGVAVRAEAEALARAKGSESLEAAYEAWALLREARVALERRAADERRTLEAQASFVVGAVRAAAAGAPASAGRGPEGRGAEDAPERSLTREAEALSALGEEAQARLSAAREQLESTVTSEKARLDAALGEARRATVERVARYAAKVKPRVELHHRPVGAERAVLHLSRPSPDDAVLLFHALTGKVPSRYGYLFDEATDDVSLAPPSLYADEGVVTSEGTRPPPDALARVVQTAGDVLPARGCIPVLREEGLYRLLMRGPVLEVERADGDGFRGMLTRVEAERFAGELLRLRLEGRLQLELRTG